MKKALCICFVLLMIAVLVSCGDEDPAKDIRVCYVDAEGTTIDIKTGNSFVEVAAVPETGYYNVAGDGTVKGEAEIKTGVITSVDTDGVAEGFEGKVIFIENGKESEKHPWGVAFSELNAKLTIMKTLYGTNPTVTFSYIAVDGVNYVLVDTIKINESNTIAETTTTTEATTEATTEVTTGATTEATTEQTTASEPTLAEILSDGETESTSVFTASNGGVDFTVTVYGYSNKDKGYDFYVKSNDYFDVDVKVENNSGKEIYKLNSSGIHGIVGAENIELYTKIGDGKGHDLTSNTAGMAYTSDLLLWSIPDGESYEWNLHLAAGYAGEYIPGKPTDLVIEGYEAADGIYLYDEIIYSGGICNFSGFIKFFYSETNNGYSTASDRQLTADVNIPVAYAEPKSKERGDRSLVEYLAEDEKECNVSHGHFNNGLGITVTLHGYTNRGKGYGLYVKGNHIVVDVTVSNNSGADIYIKNSSSVHGMEGAENVELKITLSDGKGHDLRLKTAFMQYNYAEELWSIPAGESYEWHLDFPAAGYDSEGLYIFGEDIYTDGMCEFSGTITFSYSDTDNGYNTENDHKLTANVTIPVVYVK